MKNAQIIVQNEEKMHFIPHMLAYVEIFLILEYCNFGTPFLACEQGILRSYYRTVVRITTIFR